MLELFYPLETGHSHWIITKYPAILWAMLLVLIVYNSLKKSRLFVLCYVSYFLNIKLSDESEKRWKVKSIFVLILWMLGCEECFLQAFTVWKVRWAVYKCMVFATPKKVARLVSVTSVLEWCFEEKWHVWGGSNQRKIKADFVVFFLNASLPDSMSRSRGGLKPLSHSQVPWMWHEQFINK